MRAKSVFQWPYLSTAMPPTRTLQCRTHCCLKKIIWHHDSFPSLATTVFRNRFAIAPDSCLHSFISPGASTFFPPPRIQTVLSAKCFLSLGRYTCGPLPRLLPRHHRRQLHRLEDHHQVVGAWQGIATVDCVAASNRTAHDSLPAANTLMQHSHSH